MQTTANLWEVLCQDLEAQRNLSSRDQHRFAAKKFKENALQVFRANSSRLCDAIEIAGDVCETAGFSADAISNFEDSLARNLQCGHVDSAARVATKLALILDYSNDKTRARTYYLHALQLFDAAHDHSQHCMLLNNLARLEKRASNFPACEKYYLQALESCVRLHGEIHLEVALICNNLAVAYTEAGNWLLGENMHMRALGIREQIFGAMHPEVAQSLANLAVLYHMSGNAAKAESYYKAALKTYSAFQKPDSLEIESIRANLERLHNVRKNNPTIVNSSHCA